MIARLMVPLLAVMLVASACQSTETSDGTTTTRPIGEATLPSTTTTAPDEVTVASTAEPQPITPVRVVCSTELAAFPCSALIDGSLESEWQAPNGGIGARITFSFDAQYKITEIGFLNIPGAERFLRNAKIKDVSVALDDLSQKTYIRLDDDNAFRQWFSLRSFRTAIVTVTVTSAYPGVSVGESGQPFTELALAEVIFMGTVVPYAGPPPTTSDAVEWEFTGAVIDDGQPHLCPSDVMTSLPPQCAGVPVVGLDWSEVETFETTNEVKWTNLTLTGRLSEGVFYLTRPPMPPVWRGGEQDFRTPLPCPEPDGGWRVVDEATADNESAAVAYAQTHPEFVGNWTYQLPPGTAYSVKVFMFTGHLDQHETAIRTVYGGPLCVSLAPRSLADLEAIRSQVREVIVTAEAEAAGIHLANGEYGDTIDIFTGMIEFHVLAAEDRAQDWLDAQFGLDTVVLYSRLQRVEQP
ncbi:MAG: hypothetical protein IH941_03865 [Acidobacteria bacterium]|nr:hypothetical protein [Acidobacteriota bacterium]